MTTRSFQPAWWLRNRHLQTLWPVLCRRRPSIALSRERLELPDGDFLDLCWTRRTGGPIVVVLHGLEGSIDSHYARGILAAVDARGWCGVLMHFRGCSGASNRLDRGYHSGDTGDIAAVVSTLQQRYPGVPVAAIGFSLGGNVLLKWLGETGEQSPLVAAAAISVPFLLDNCARRLEHGLSRLYQWHLVNRMVRSLRRKFANRTAPIEFGDLDMLRTFRGFDDRVTAPLHGFSGVDDYYRKASSRQYLPGIRVPTLILHARDDPFMTPAAIPATDELPACVELELSERGGHVGFIAGRWPWTAEYWLERRIPGFLDAWLESVTIRKG